MKWNDIETQGDYQANISGCKALTGKGHEPSKAVVAVVGDGGVRRAVARVSLSVRLPREPQAAGPQGTL